MTAYDIWLEPPDEPDDPFEDDAEPNDYPFEAGDWRADERETLLEQSYER
ncbi:hypothetical protein FBY06_11571 [Pseudomonas sp. SJZ085]|nr:MULTISPECIES: hypothetical protein [unclassified Pseudomonas]TWC18146.1 hypothetical protein FBX99_11571 [Pseudomonas sp. SJZ074]TWC36118.1 hypothetical protein FBY06_11571 [Pseudomonas sp. SJZ085]